MKHKMKLKTLALLFFIGAIALNVMAVQPVKGYKLSGTISGARNGEKVFISTYDLPDTGFMPKIINLDSTIINNGRFLFNGRIKEPQLYIITYRHHNNVLVQFPFILENADIVMSLDTAGKGKNNKVTGSKNTELFIEYSKGVNKQLSDKIGIEKFKIFNSIYNKPTGTPAMHEEAMNIVKEYSKRI